MRTWLLIALVAVHLFSLLNAGLVFKNMNHVLRSHAHSVGDQFSHLFFTRRLKFAKVVYIISLVGLAIFTFIAYVA